MRREEILKELEKLNVSQRKAMRLVVASPIDVLRIEKAGWKTRVVVWSCGFRYRADLGPRGAVLCKETSPV